MEQLPVYDMTFQIRVADFEAGSTWYEALLRRSPDFIPHDDFIEWELIKGCWLQLAKGEPAIGSGPLRFGVSDIEKERQRIISELGVEVSEVYTREGVPVKWCTFDDPFGNRLGFYQHLD
ncbi:VOC family protein [Brevibacillus daliensis]|uniref:VOC family protein n=1 Tax=Brevibacillus daliensis TaxID=2892995 RepID=UPI001E3D3253|nr:VOC family protein [Brevibacillus daliensis]